MAKYGKKAQAKVKRAMHELKEGTLRSGRGGKKVTSRKQAVAIGLSEARQAGGKVPMKTARKTAKKSTAKKSTKMPAKKTSAKKTSAKKTSAKKSGRPAAKRAAARRGTTRRTARKSSRR